MIKSKKQMFTIIGVFILMLLLGTTTYAFFNYTRTGTSNTIRVGRISFVTRQTSTINLTNVFPIDSANVDTDTDNVDEVVIEITGDTDYAGGIEYLVSSKDASIYTTSGIQVPVSLDITVDDLGTESNNYFVSRDNTNESIYKQIVGDTLVGDGMLLVGYIVPNETSGTAEGIDGSITIKAFFDKDKILISDTYDGSESDNMGTTNNQANNKTVISTSEWNALQTNGVSFKIKVEANEGVWVNGSLEEIMKKTAIMDNINSEFVDNETPGINFGAFSSDTNGKGVYIRAGTENDDYPIMYYRGEIEDNNVILAGKCWKTVRTTDTGGVKLIYNGEAKYDYAPINQSSYTIITNSSTSPFTFDSTDNTWNATVTDANGTEISFNVPANSGYEFIMTGTTGSSTGGSYYIYKDDTEVYINGGGGGYPFSRIQDFGTLTSSNIIKFTYTGSGSSESPITFKIKMAKPIEELGLKCKNTGEDTRMSFDVNGYSQNSFPFNRSNNSPAYSGYMYGTVYEYSTSGWTSGARFGSGFTWDGTNYTLVDDEITTPNETHHYSCNVTTEDGTCQELRYVYYVSGSTQFYITLTGGDGVEEAIVKMNTNINDSYAKDKIETWYASQMTGVTNKLEDTIWCNDRSFGDGNNNGWIANGGSLSIELYYGAYQRSAYASNSSAVKNQPSLACANKNDSFTWKNNAGNGALDYPIGLLTEDEIVLAGGLSVSPYESSNETFYLESGTNYWTMSPNQFLNTVGSSAAMEFDSGLRDNFVSNGLGLRPSISLKPGQLITKGTGTETDPYVIE